MEVGSNRPAWNEVVDKAEFPDSRHMVLKLREPYVPLVNRLWDYNFGPKIVPKELNERPDLSADKMIGTGYRILDKAQPSITYEFKAHADYWAGKPYIDRWHYPIITEAANRYAQFLTKNLMSHSPNARDALKTRTDAPDAIMVGSEIVTYSVNRMIFGKREKDTMPWKDPRVRIAIHKAVDWEAINNFQSNKEQFAQAGIAIEQFRTTHVPGDPSYYLDPWKEELGKSSSNYFFDPAAAKQLIEAAGFPNGIDVDMYFNSGNTTTPSQANVDDWALYLDFFKRERNIPIRMNSVYMTNQEYLERIVYEADIKGIQYNRPSAGTDIDYNLFRNYSSKYHLAAYTDPKLDEIIDKQRREADPLKRAEYIKDFQRFVADSFAGLPGPWRNTGWSFQWDWLRNTNYKVATGHGGHKEWLAADMPHRNG
jgi:ABC-type transport system substrate-binding protein